mgnify:CR=1 FL=1
MSPCLRRAWSCRVWGHRVWAAGLLIAGVGSACEPQPSSSTTSGGSTASTVAAPTATPTAATGVTAGPSAGPSAEPGANATEARPLYYEREIGEDDLRGRSLRELSLLRNTIYARAGNPFRRPWLHAHFSAQSWYAPKETWDPSKITPVDKKNARTIADYDAALTQEALEAMRDEVLARRKAGKARPEDEVELSLLSQRLGTWLGDEGATRTALEDPDKLDELLTLEQLSTLSRRDLRILRNMVYARRGRSFDSKVVRSYFEGATWYKPRPDYFDGMLTPVDRKNIALVFSVEQSLGGPLHENPDYGKEGWFFQA